LANAVLLLPRWPYAEAILPVDSLLDSLVGLSQRLVAEDLPNVVFVLDAERTRAVRIASQDDTSGTIAIRLTVADLPNLAGLRARHRRIVKISVSLEGTHRGEDPPPPWSSQPIRGVELVSPTRASKI